MQISLDFSEYKDIPSWNKGPCQNLKVLWSFVFQIKEINSFSSVLTLNFQTFQVNLNLNGDLKTFKASLQNN